MRNLNFTLPSLYTLNLFEKQNESTAMARLRKIIISGQAENRARDIDAIVYQDVSDSLDKFKYFCVSCPRTVVVLRFGLVGDTDSDSWQRRCFMLKGIIRGREALPSILLTQDYNIRRIWWMDGVSEAKIRDVPGNLRFSILCVNPDAEVVESNDDLTVEEEAELAIKRYARDLWEDGF